MKPDFILRWAHPIVWGGTALFCRYVYGMPWWEVFAGLSIVAVMVGIPIVLIRMKFSTTPTQRTIDAPYWHVVGETRGLLEDSRHDFNR